MIKKLEVLGLVCPFPLVRAKQEISQLSSGDELVIDFDCTQATETIPRWATEAGHRITRFEKTGPAQWSITLKKK
jgi:Predicted redox protein, regulator of disulfide bond formation